MGVDARMLVRTSRPLTAEQVRSLAADVVGCFGNDTLWVNRDGAIFPPRHAMTILSEPYVQDGPDMKPNPGEQFIEVHLWGRYYGVGYERGDLPAYCAIASWLEHRIPGCVVYYGGDSSGILAEPFGPEVRERLWSHFCAVGHQSYHGVFDRGEKGPKESWCDFCNRQMERYGYGNTYAMYRCSGCEWQVDTRDGGVTWRSGDAKKLEREDDARRAGVTS